MCNSGEEQDLCEQRKGDIKQRAVNGPERIIPKDRKRYSENLGRLAGNYGHAKVFGAC